MRLRRRNTEPTTCGLAHPDNIGGCTRQPHTDTFHVHHHTNGYGYWWRTGEDAQ